MMQSNFFRISLGIIMLLVIIYLGSTVGFIFQPLISLVHLTLVPVLLALFFYYLLRPVVNYLEKQRIKRAISIILIYLVIIAIIVGFSMGVWPTLRTQITNFVMNAPELINNLTDQLKEWQKNRFIAGLLPEGSDPLSQLSEALNRGLVLASDYLSGIFSFVSTFVIVIATFPIILYYMLKEGDKFSKSLLHVIPKRYHKDGREVMAEIDEALGSFIVGRVLINVALGIMMYIGFLIIGLPYALLLTVVSVILNFIPYVGAILAAIPVVIIGFIESPSMAIWSLVVIVVAQQLQDNLLSPIVYGKQLDIHPLTTVILLLLGGDLGGILGIIIVIPLYMVIKIIIRKVYQLFLERKMEDIMD
ncbi:AI-2E family transporter [Paenibacillus sp. JX-17]|uniref:AI-2E family transporter n=1 Tax=Paenibacillus lacisoli TaxID=3064525 RepID=A0ABT9CEA0_9BACL|nr:AI-2E family transporter [Paenibacillus sp. JX-17]MDO7907195.1 AI-2E family transporter [Paenibacillus sp. JX-17]